MLYGEIDWDAVRADMGEESISDEAIDLINKLLKKNPDQRLGTRGGAAGS